MTRVYGGFFLAAVIGIPLGLMIGRIKMLRQLLDPTINLLEARAAEIFGREAAIFVPTGSMGNQIALRLHTQQGQEVVCESRAHVMDWEMGMAAMFSGCQLRTVVGPVVSAFLDDVTPATPDLF